MKVLRSEENDLKVANRTKVKKIKGQNFGLLLLLLLLVDFLSTASDVWDGAMVLALT